MKYRLKLSSTPYSTGRAKDALWFRQIRWDSEDVQRVITDGENFEIEVDATLPQFLAERLSRMGYLNTVVSGIKVQANYGE